MSTKLLLLMFVAMFPVSAMSASPEMSPQEFQTRAQICESLNNDPQSFNDCYYDLSVDSKDPFVCDEITWNFKKVACKRRVMFYNPWSAETIIPQIPFLVFFVFLLALIFSAPPRSNYIKGMAFGAVFSGILIYLEGASNAVATFTQPYLHYFIIPIEGMARYSPYFFQKFLQPNVQLIIVQMIFYGIVVGLLLHGERKQRQQAVLVFIFGLILTFWEHPWLHFLHEWIATLLS